MYKSQSLYVGLDDDVDILDLTLFDLTGQIIQRHGTGRVALFFHTALQALLCNLTRFLIVFKCLEDITGDRYIVETDDLDRHGRQRLFDLTASVIDHLTHTAVGLSL